MPCLGMPFDTKRAIEIIYALFIWKYNKKKNVLFLIKSTEMTNVNKINSKQTDVMAQFMFEHPHLDKNLLPNCGQGKETAERLCEELSNCLNTFCPPTKEVVVWRKVFADQKHNVKKKLSFNMESKKKTGGGPYEEI